MPIDDPTVLAAPASDEAAFSALAERHRRELHVHCYRMLGSLDDAEDAVQETLLRAWRGRATFDAGRPGASLRAWLYRIATNVCLDALKRLPRRVLASSLGPPHDPALPALAPVDLPWLEPYPDTLLDGIAAAEDGPEAVVVSRETIEIAFLAAIQLLPPRQRATVILFDVLGWSARETAELLDTSVAAVNSALQRARATLERHLPAGRAAPVVPITEPTAQERAIARRYMEAFERGDAAAVAALLADDARATMPPYPMWFDSAAAIATATSLSLDPASPDYVGRWKARPVTANRMPAMAGYVQAPGATSYDAFALGVLRIEQGRIAEITAFGPELFAAFGLPPTW